MAGLSSGKTKGVAVEKRAKMDKVQQEILLAVCIAAALVGFTLVTSIFMIKKVSFKSRVGDAQEKVIKSYKDMQSSLTTLESEVSDLANDENLESVAMDRREECRDYLKKAEDGDASLDDIENVRTCSSLRVIPDALPMERNVNSMLTSFADLIENSNGGNGAKLISMGGGDSGNITTDGFEALRSENLYSLSSSVVLEDTSDKIYATLTDIERSIRNFDIVNAHIEWTSNDMIRISSSFASYYMESKALGEGKYTVCSDPDSEACKKKGGDSFAKDKNKKAASSEKEK